MPIQQNIARDDAITAIRFPIKLLTVALVLTILAFAGFGWIIFDDIRDAKMFTGRISRIEELRGIIVHLDEVLTTSARMAAATGDLQWEERYRRFEPQLDAAIKETTKMGTAPPDVKAMSETDAANLKLVAMENRAFALVRAGHKQEAQAVLFNPEYETQKGIYAEGINSFVDQLKREFDESLRHDQRSDLILIIVATIGGGISLVAWVSAARGMHHWRVQLLDSFHRRAEAEENLHQAHAELEVRVEERTAELANANKTLQEEIAGRKRAQAELENIHKQLVDASRRGGMAEIATNVLHNVGNVLNSVNISTGLIVESVKKSRVSSLASVVVLLQEHAHDLGAFLTNDSRGKHVPALLAQLSEHLVADRDAIGRELDSLRGNVEHIKEIVAMQQNYATVGGVKEMINVVNLVEDSMRINEGTLSRHGVEVIREFETVPLMNVEKHKILQILVNLIRNGKHACQASDRVDKRLTVRVANGDGRVRISVIDNGIGISPENLARIFSHGFTTRKGGHGFGLHSGALAAREMDGSLTVHSDGPGQGAAFTLELPCPLQGNSHD